MNDELRMVFDADPTLSDEDHLRQKIGVWNMKVTSHADYHPAYFFLRDAEDKVRGGILSYVWGKWLHVDILWLDEDIHRQGWGTKLLEAAHQAGREKGAESAWLDTFSWQAKPFYERFGYETVFEVKDFPPGFSRIYMRKTPL